MEFCTDCANKNNAYILYEKQNKRTKSNNIKVVGVALEWLIADNWVKEDPSNRFFAESILKV